MLSEIYGVAQDRVGKILAVTERMQKIDKAIDTIRYDNELYMEVPDVVKTLADAKAALIAELKTI